MSEGIVVTYDPSRDALIGPDGEVVTEAQRKKAEAIIRLGLLSLKHRKFQRHGRVNLYECRPLPGCHLTYELTHGMMFEAGVVMSQTWACTCQAARGTKKAAARRCSHILALKQLVQGASQ